MIPHLVGLSESHRCILRSLKPGKVVIVLRGKYAGKKAVITRVSEEPTNATNFGHAYIAGIAEYPLPVCYSPSFFPCLLWLRVVSKCCSG